MSTAPEINYDITIHGWITAVPARPERLDRAHDRQRWEWVPGFWIEGEAEGDLSTVYTTTDPAPYGAPDRPRRFRIRRTSRGTVVVFLGLDKDHHEVHVDAYTFLGNLGAVRQAMTELQRVEARLAQFESLT